MDRSNHYEAAFEAHLRSESLCYIAVDETRRSLLGGERLKSLDFVVFGRDGSGLLVDVKGRRFPAGPPGRPRRVWESWSTADDVAGLERWAGRFGVGYRGLFVFAYDLADSEHSVTGEWEWRGRRYSFRAIAADLYRQRMRVRSPRWHTVDLPRSAYLELAHPVHHFTGACITAVPDCPF